MVAVQTWHPPEVYPARTDARELWPRMSPTTAPIPPRQSKLKMNAVILLTGI